MQNNDMQMYAESIEVHKSPQSKGFIQGSPWQQSSASPAGSAFHKRGNSVDLPHIPSLPSLPQIPGTTKNMRSPWESPLKRMPSNAHIRNTYNCYVKEAMLPPKHFIPARSNLSMFRNKKQITQNMTFYQDAANIKMLGN
jgi:hypothetical protein